MISLIQITKQALQGKGDVTPQRVDQHLPFVIRAMKDMSYNNLKMSKEILIDVDTDTWQATLPGDFIKHIAVGYLADGKFKSLGYNESILPFLTVDNCGNVVYTGGEPCAASTNVLWENQVNNFGEFTGGQYGSNASKSYPAYYKVIDDMGVIQLSSDAQVSKIVLKYVSTLIEPGRATMVNEMATEPIIARAYYLSVRDRKTVGLGEKQRALVASNMANEAYTINRNPLNSEEFLQVIRSGWTQAPKM